MAEVTAPASHQGGGAAVLITLAAIALMVIAIVAVIHAQVSWHHEQQNCERTGGVWLAGRDLHKCIYGDVRETP